jgi:hypothetical protein
MLKRLREWYRRRQFPELARIELQPGGFAVVPRDEPRRHVVRWASVRRITAYKRDLITTDEIRLAFETDELLPGSVEVSEEYGGFQEIFGALERELGVSPKWYWEIMVPPFARSEQVVYERAEAGGSRDTLLRACAEDLLPEREL